MAVYVPDPDNLAPAGDLIEGLGAELAARYAEAEDELIRQVAKRSYRDIALRAALAQALARADDTQTLSDRIAYNRAAAELAAYRAQTVRELQFLAIEMAEKLRQANLAEEFIAVASAEGEAAAVARLKLAGRLPSSSALTGTAAQAVASLTLDMSSRLEAVHLRITRYPQDAYQRIISFTSSTQILSAQTMKVAQAQAVQRFLSEGITGFVDKADRRWRIGSYAEMAGRTYAARAYNDAGIWRMQQSGVNLVTVQGGLDSCKRCAPWVGKILSADGTTGTVTLPHATRDEQVTVVIAATLEQARAAGLFHPNCRHKATAYLPGLSIPQETQEYDPEAERAREKQREIERGIRQAKREEATAGDDVSRKRAQRDIAERQAQMREHLRVTGRPRANYREQLRFADGGNTPRPTTAPRPPARPAPARTGAVTSSMKPHEQAFFRRMETLGETIDWIPQDRIGRKPTNDFRWVSRGGFETELKSTQAKYQSIRNRVHEAAARAKLQGVIKENFVIDLGRARLSDKLRTQLEQYNERTRTTPIRRLYVLDRDRLVEIALRAKK